MKSGKILTIVTVCYNSELTIRDTLESMCIQDLSEVEYIVVDGASTDRTLDIIKEYSDIVDVLISEKDYGIYDAMNKGGNSASGEYLAFLNSDDYYSEGLISDVIKSIKSDRSDAIITQCDLVKENGDLSQFKNNLTKNELHYQIPFMHPSAFVKREIFKQLGGFDLQYKLAADCDFLQRFLLGHPRLTEVGGKVNMRFGGASEQGFYLSRWEYFQVSNRNGLNKFFNTYGLIKSMLMKNLVTVKGWFW